MNQNDAFWRQIASAQDEVLARVSSVEREAMRLAAPAAPRPRSRRAALTFGVFAGLWAATAAAVLVLRPRPLTFEVGDGHAPVAVGAAISAPSSAPLSLDFSDGSTVRLGAAARGRVARVGPHGAALVVERGHADISVVPRPGGSWGVDVGPFHVAVKGTRFSLDWDAAAERLDFALERGAVVITAACLDQPRSLVAGQSLHASCRWQPADLPPALLPPRADAPPAPAAWAEPAEPPALAPPAARERYDARARAVPRVGAREAAWRQLASAQQYGDALAAAERSGFEGECRRAPAGDLLVLGDVARLAGNPARAVQAYTAARARHAPGDRSSFALGLVEFDQRRDYARAATWFSTYLREQPRGPLAEQAEGRLMEAWQRAGEPSRAKQVARAYLAHTPSGAYADLARQTLR